MPRTREELERAADEAEAWLDNLDPASVEWEDASDLAAIGRALRAVADAETALTDAVATARGNGKTWGMIALQLGVSRQAASERYGDRVEAS